jgi:DNA-binding transcriptional LysR family regulator
VAQPDVSEVIIGLGRQFPLLQPRICNDISCQLLARLHLGELDGAIVVMPVDTALRLDLEGVTLSPEPMRLVQARTATPPKIEMRRILSATLGS